MKKWKCDNGHTYKVPDKACIVCNHCTDVFWDYTNGPYALICEKQTLDGEDLPCMIDWNGENCPYWEGEE